MLDRLIELIDKGERSMRGKTICGGIKGQRAYIAEYLLENDVIVPPCKVGDIVYQVTRNFISEFRVRCIEIGVSSGQHSLIILHTELLSGITTTGEVLWANDFGKTVFLTRKEAEKALKKGVK